MSDIIERARALRAKIEELATEHLDDGEAESYAELFPAWNSAAEYAAGEKVRYEGKVYKCLQAHTAQAGWTAEDAPSLWAEVLAGQDGSAIGKWTQPDSTNPYMSGDKVTYNGKTYESAIDNNVWSPEAYPAGWREVTGA